MKAETRVLIKRSLVTGAIVTVAATLLLAWSFTDQRLISDRRFMLAEPVDEGDSPLHIEGVRYASREHIEEVFRPDFGRSVYLFPLTERRRQLLAVEWVKDARVSRIWPNQISIQVTERRPVAFVRPHASDGGAPPLLVDDEGVLLTLRDPGRFRLPAVIGLAMKQPLGERAMRVKRMLRMQAEIGRQMDRVSEVDLSDPDNLKITYPFEDRAMVLFLGHGHYAQRLKKFFDHFEEIRTRMPGARVLDLRLEDRITTVEEPHGARNAG